MLAVHKRPGKQNYTQLGQFLLTVFKPHVTPPHSHEFVSLKQQMHKDLFLYYSFLFLQRILV